MTNGIRIVLVLGMVNWPKFNYLIRSSHNKWYQRSPSIRYGERG